MQQSPLPPELQRRWGNLRFIRQRTASTWSAECPQCRDSGHFGNDWPDRFTMWDKEPGRGARGYCRQCDRFWWADDDLPSYRPSREQLEQANQERLKLLREENQRIKEKLQKVASADFWRRWHDEMTNAQRELWYREGVNDYLIETFNLGYCPQYVCYYKGQEWQTPTMTIPHYGHDWKLANIQHRLLSPPQPNDKYRNMAGVPMSLFLTDPDNELNGPTLLFEGAKKSLVMYLRFAHKLTVVGIPSKTPSKEMLDQLSNCDPLYIAIDPDAYNGHAQRIGEQVECPVRFVRWPEKPDDMVVKYGFTDEQMWKYVQRATLTA